MASPRLLEKPLPKPREGLAAYASARVLEALLEAMLALEFLERGYVRNAAGKAFQAWKALVAALLALEWDKVAGLLGEDERRWVMEVGMARVPTGRLKPLSKLVERIGYRYFSLYTSVALDLHDYQYHGPDPSGELSKYPSEEDAADDIVTLLQELVEIVSSKAKPLLQKAGAWTDRHEESTRQLKERLKALARSAEKE